MKLRIADAAQRVFDAQKGGELTPWGSMKPSGRVEGEDLLTVGAYTFAIQEPADGGFIVTYNSVWVRADSVGDGVRNLGFVGEISVQD